MLNNTVGLLGNWIGSSKRGTMSILAASACVWNADWEVARHVAREAGELVSMVTGRICGLPPPQGVQNPSVAKDCALLSRWTCDVTSPATSWEIVYWGAR